MRKIALAFAILGTTLVPALYSAPAHAQRTWVSGVGDDANPCSRTAPCKTFAGAISKTANGGEIDCLDPGGFGALTITKSISIICDQVSNGGVLVAGTNGIVFAGGPTDKVLLQGLDIEGLGTGLNGVLFNSGVELIIRKCTSHDFTQNGVSATTSTANARMVVVDSVIFNNGVNGTANTGGINVTQNGGLIIASILNVKLENNQNYALQASGGSAAVALANSFLSPTGLSLVNGGAVVSQGPSNIIGGGTTPPNVPFK